MIVDRDVVQRTVGFHVDQRTAFLARDPGQPVDLPGKRDDEHLMRKVEGAAAETLAVRVRWVRANADPAGKRQAHGLPHGALIPGVPSAGDVGGRDDGQQGRVGRGAFAEVGVEVDAHVVSNGRRNSAMASFTARGCSSITI